MRDHIRDVLVARILDGTYPAGTQLKELYLAREFDVSQAPIREALRELEGSGLVTCERFRGTRVRGADFEEMRESYELRMMLEVHAVLLAAPYQAELIGALGAFLREMDAAVKASDSERYIDNALRFHRRLVESSGNRTFLSVWDSLLWDIRGRIALRRLAERGRSLRSLRQHASSAAGAPAGTGRARGRPASAGDTGEGFVGVRGLISARHKLMQHRYFGRACERA